MLASELKALATSWLTNKKVLDESKKTDKALRDKLKKVMVASGKDAVKTSAGVATITYAEVVDFDEEAMLEYLREIGETKYIKRVVTYEVDFALMESDVFNGELDPAALSKFRRVTKQPRIGSIYDIK